MALGLKTIETRGHRTHLRGDLVICSTLTLQQDVFDELRARLVPSRVSAEMYDLWCTRLGEALCIVSVTGCRPLVRDDEPNALFFADGRFAWETDPELLRLVHWTPARGMPGQFSVDRATLARPEYSYTCASGPECLCSEDADQCDCIPALADVLTSKCRFCSAKMRAINFNTGEPLGRGRISSWEEPS